MSDELVIAARWSQKNAVGMTIDADEVEAICAMADRIEELETKLVAAEARVGVLTDRASDYLRIAEDIGSCGDGGCVVFQQKGQHTNGGCRCIDCLDRGELRRLNRLLMIAQATMKLIIKGEQP